jgi:hypothetical protein
MATPPPPEPFDPFERTVEPVATPEDATHIVGATKVMRWRELPDHVRRQFTLEHGVMSRDHSRRMAAVGLVRMSQNVYQREKTQRSEKPKKAVQSAQAPLLEPPTPPTPTPTPPERPPERVKSHV